MQTGSERIGESGPGVAISGLCDVDPSFGRDPLFVAELEEWSQLLSRFPTTLDLPTDYPRPVHRSYREKDFIPALVTTIYSFHSALCGSFRSNSLYVVGWFVCFFVAPIQWAGTVPDRTVMSNRRAPEWQSTVGYLANTVPLPMDLSGDPALETFFARVREICVTADHFQHIPLESVIRKMNIHVTPEISPLIQVMFTYQVSTHSSSTIPWAGCADVCCTQ